MSVAVAQQKIWLLEGLFWGCLFVLWKRKSACWPVLIDSYRAVQVSLAKMRISWPGTYTGSGQVTEESFLCYKSLFLNNAVIIWLRKSINLYAYLYKVWRKEEIFVKVNQQCVLLLVSQVGHDLPSLWMGWITEATVRLEFCGQFGSWSQRENEMWGK